MKSWMRMGGVGGLFGIVILIVMLVAIPITLYQKVPLARRDVALLYQEAAREWEASTQADSTAFHVTFQGARVDWKEAIAFDAVRRKQDFRYVTKESILRTMALFTEEHEASVDLCIEDSCPHQHRWHTARRLKSVMEAQRFSDEQKAWAYELQRNAYLLLERDIRCEYDVHKHDWSCNK